MDKMTIANHSISDPNKHLLFTIGMAVLVLFLLPLCYGDTNIALSKSCTADSEPDFGYYCDKLFDGSNSTYWYSNPTDPHFVIVDVGSVQSIGRTDIKHFVAGAEYITFNFILECSNASDSGYVTYATYVSNTDIMTSAVGTPLCTGRYFRMTITKSMNSAASVARLHEISIYDYPAPAPVFAVTDIKLVNSSRTEFVSINEYDNFYIQANYTGNTTTDVCNFTAENITSHKSYYSTTNLTLNTSTQYETTFSDSTANALKDTYYFKVCRASGNAPNADIQLLHNKNITETIKRNIIPNCPDFHYEFNTTTAYLSNSSINMTLKCVNCLTTQYRIIPINQTQAFVFDRYYSVHTEPLTYNSSNGYYEFSNYFYRFPNVGTDKGNITVKCNATSRNEKYNVSDIPLFIDIISINNMTFTQGMNIERDDIMSFLYNVRNDVVNFKQMNITYYNGTVILSTSEEFVNISGNLFTPIGIHNISISATDNDGTTTTLKTYFNLNDTIDPMIVWTYPDSTNTTKINVNVATDFFLDVAFIDNSLFAYEVIVRDASGNLIENFTDSDIDGVRYDLYQLIENSNATLGNWTITATVSDDHTATAIQDYKVTTSANDIEFNITNGKKLIEENSVLIKYLSGRAVKVSPVVWKDTDRYKWKYDFIKDTSKQDFKHEIEIRCKNIIFRENSDYIGHFICPISANWIDFESKDIKEWNIKSCGKDCYRFLFTANNADSIEFSSIGGLNIVTQAVRVEFIDVPIVISLGFGTFDLTTQTNLILLFIIILLWAFTIASGFIFHRAFFVASLCFGVIIGVMLSSLSMMLFFAPVVLSLAFFIMIFNK